MKHLQTYQLVAAEAASTGQNDLCSEGLATAKEAFLAYRRSRMTSIETGITEWNGAVASAVERVGKQDGLTSRMMTSGWHTQVASALRRMEHPLHSDIILSVNEPYLTNRLMQGRVRTFGTITMSEDPEFMPTTQAEWPRFPYFLVEPGTSRSLAEAGLVLLANPPGVAEDEPDEVGAAICSTTYARSPMVSMELQIDALPNGREGAVLINWSFRGRQGAHAKIFIDGLQDVPAFPVASSDEDRTPNFWTILPMRPGTTVVDLKHVGAGFLWFEHADVHTVTW